MRRQWSASFFPHGFTSFLNGKFAVLRCSLMF
jgi:hypothetical protein